MDDVVTQLLRSSEPTLFENLDFAKLPLEEKWRVLKASHEVVEQDIVMIILVAAMPHVRRLAQAMPFKAADSEDRFRILARIKEELRRRTLGLFELEEGVVVSSDAEPPGLQFSAWIHPIGGITIKLPYTDTDIIAERWER